VRSGLVKLALPELKSGDVESAHEVVLRVGTKNPPKFLEQVNAFKVLEVAAREGKSHEVEVQVIALGDEVTWVSLPGEIFVESGLEIKRKSPFRHTMIAELANGAIGYIPNEKAYDESNYEPMSARCAKGSGEKLVESTLRPLQEVHSSNWFYVRSVGVPTDNAEFFSSFENYFLLPLELIRIL
jgi:hypothetical protein